jgi:hypothetical protein
MAKFLALFAILMALMTIGDHVVMAGRQRRKRKESERDITAEEVDEITDDKKIEDNEDTIAKTKILEEWDEHMKDFVPEDMLTVELNTREEIVS